MWELSRGHVDISLDKSRGAFIGKGQIKKEEEVRLTERTLFATFLFFVLSGVWKWALLGDPAYHRHFGLNERE